MDLLKKCVVLLLLQYTGEALEISAPTTYEATKGLNNRIPCEYTVQNPPVNPEFFAAFWLFQGKEVLSFNDEVSTTDPRYSLDTKKALLGRVDLSISDISVSDAGVYTCSVLYSPILRKKDITVDVKAPPQVTITDKTVVLNTVSVLRCSATGFFPPDIDITWFRGSEVMTNVIVDPPLRNPDRTYSVNSTVTITPTEEDRERIFSCRVRHLHLQEPLQEDFLLMLTDNSVTSGDESPIAIISGIGAVVVTVLIILLVFWIYKKKRTPQQPKPENIEEGTRENRPDPSSAPPQVTVTDRTVVVNAKSVLRCSATGFCTANIDVKWFRGTKILNNNAMNTPLRSQGGLYSVNSTVTITPTEEDREQEFSCRVQHESLKEPIQKTFRLIFTDQTSSLPINKNGKSPRSPDEKNSQNIPDHDQRCNVIPDKERNPLKKQDTAGLKSVNASTQEKAPLQFQKNVTEQKTKQLRESDAHKNTPSMKNRNSQELCPGNELPREEDIEEHPLPTDKGGHKKKTHPVQARCTKKNEEEVIQEKENEETSHLIIDSSTEQEINASMESPTGEGEEEMKKKKKKREDNDKSSHLISIDASTSKGDESQAIAKEGSTENSEGGPPGDSEGGPPGDSEGEPPGDSEEGPPGDSEGEPPGDSKEGASGDSEGGPPGDSEGEPPGDSEEGPPGDSEGGPPGDSKEGPSGDSEEGPLGDSEGGPPGDSEGGPPGDSEEGPLGDSEGGPPGDSEGGPPGDSKGGPLGDSEGEPPLGDSEGGPPGDREGEPPGDSEGEPLEDSKVDSQDEETSQLLRTEVSANKVGADTIEISKEGRIKTSEGCPPEDSDNEETPLLNS